MVTLEISNKNIEVDYADNLECKFAVFIIEFDYDNRLYVGHTIMRSVKTEIITLNRMCFLKNQCRIVKHYIYQL